MLFQHGDDALDFSVGDERSVQTADAAPACHEQQVALAEQLFGALLTKDGARVDLACDLVGDAGREVGFDGAGDDVDRGTLRRHDDVDAGGARHLRETLHRGFDFLAGRDHQIGHLVDDDDDVGHRLQGELAGFVDRLAAGRIEAGVNGALEALAALKRVGDAIIVAGDVAHAELGHAAIAIFHLAHDPFQRDDGFLRIGDDRVEEVRECLRRR